uniref:Rab3 GTPase-activating protein non-catalytic subunit n=1 Tax=Parastrongyloides trichosuri TaxID=131310 RepID=A0A0N4ZUC5_PARTI
MSCEENLISQLSDNQIGKINNFLFKDVGLNKDEIKDIEIEVSLVNSTDDGNNSEDDEWNLDSSVEGIEKGNEESNDNWIKNCLIGVSFNVEYIVLANVKKFIVLERKGKQVNIIAEKDISQFLDNPSYDFIRCVYVLPIAGKGKTDTGHITWTCIILGLSTGQALFFTENGILIFKEQISHFAVKRIDFDISTLPGYQELCFLCKNRLVVFEGKGLQETLNSARSKIAKQEMNIDEISMTLYIPCHVLYLENGLQSEDFQITRPFKPSLFDRLVEASFSEEGIDAVISSKPIPVYSTYITTGGNGWAVFNWWDKDSGRDLIKEGIHNVKKIVTEGVASYMPSFGIRSFFGLSTSQSKNIVKKDFPYSIPYSHAPAKCILKDEGRRGERIFKAPEPWDYVLICDSIARISLVCTRTNLVLKMWKGYRDAKCAFYETHGIIDLKNEKCKSKTLFIIFFLPRRALIEVWSLRTGKRVCALHGDKNGRLLPIQNKILGCRHDGKSLNNNMHFVYIKPNGMIMTYTMPFSLSLCHELDASIHDKNLISEIRNLLRNGNNNKWYEMVVKLQYPENIIKEHREYLFNEKISLTHKIDTTKKLIDDFKNNGIKDTMTVILEYLYMYETFFKVQNLNKINDSNIDIIFDMPKDFINDVIEVLKLSKKEEANEDEIINLEKFLNVAYLNDWIINDDLKHKKDILLFSRFVFFPLLSEALSMNQFTKEFSKLPFDIFCITKLYITYFLSSTNNIKSMDLFKTGMPILKMFFHQIPFFERFSIINFIDKQIIESTNVKNALILSIHLFQIYQNSNNIKKDKEDENTSNEWEDINMKNEDLFLSIKHLYILTLISTLPQAPEVSLEKLNEKKFSFYREILGIWLSQFYDSQTLLLTALTSTEDIMPHCHISELTPLPIHLRGNSLSLQKLEDNNWLMTFKKILKNFPLSINVEYLFADVTWECGSLWNKSKWKNISKLRCCINSLKILKPYPLIQHGLGLMIWDTFLRIPFKSLFELLNLSGDPPSDKQLKRIIGISEIEIVEFTICVKDLLKCMMNALNCIDKPDFKEIIYEDFYVRFFDIGTKGEKNLKKDTLIEISMQKDLTNYHLILHHYHLITIIYLQLSLSLLTRPRFLFDQIGNRAFFDSFYSHPLITISDVDKQCMKRRQEFLEQAIENFCLEDDDYALQYWSIVFEISNEWNIDIDALRIKEIYLFYRHSMDSRGEKAMSNLVKSNLLIPTLIPIIAFRIRCLFEKNPETANIIKNQIISVNTAVSYIDALEFDEIESKEYEPIHLIRLIKRLLMIMEEEHIINDSSKHLLKNFLEIVLKFEE